jgi:hypothetical protein
MPKADLVVLLGRSAMQITNKARQMKLKRSIEFIEATRFKAGRSAGDLYNWIEVGTRRDDGRYIRVKLADGSWVLEHRWVWEQANGPIPDDCVVVAEDGNIRNTDLANLTLVTKDEHCRRNQVRKYPAELQDVILARQELKRAIREKTS